MVHQTKLLIRCDRSVSILSGTCTKDEHSCMHENAMLCYDANPKNMLNEIITRQMRIPTTSTCTSAVHELFVNINQ